MAEKKQRGRQIDPQAERSAQLEELFRSRKVWRDFCVSIVESRRCCEVCGKELSKKFVKGKYKGRYCKKFNVHHRYDCKTMGEYMDLSGDRFLLLCPDCHQWVHRVCNSPRFKDMRWFVKPDKI